MSLSREKSRLTNSAGRLPKLPPIAAPTSSNGTSFESSYLRTYRRSEQMQGLLADILYVYVFEKKKKKILK